MASIDPQSFNESRSELRKQKSGDIPIADVEPFKDWLRSSGGRRAEGKGAYARGDFVGAVASFTLCLRRIDCDDAAERSLLLANRSAAYLAAGAPHCAAADAYDLLDLRPEWPKSYLRLAHASRAMGSASDAEDWYSAGANAATMQGLAKDAAKLQGFATASAAAAAAADAAAAAPPRPPGSSSSSSSSSASAAEAEVRLALLHRELATRMGIESRLFYTPICLEDRALELAVGSSPRFYADLTSLFGCDVIDMGPKNRGLIATRAFAVGEPVFLDEPLFRVCLSQPLPEESAPPRGAPADCAAQLRALRAQCTAAAAAEKTDAAFFPLAVVRIAGITLARSDAEGTFELPEFACLCRASDFPPPRGAGEYKVSFVERYNMWTTVRDALGLGGGAHASRFDFKWFDDVWSMLLVNMIGGTTVREADSFALMKLGSFCNHSDLPTLETYEVNGGERIGFVATRAIAAGDALTICYVDPDLEESVRASILREQYLISGGEEEEEDGDGVD